MDNKLSTLSLGGRLKFLAKDSSIYGGASAINKMIAIFTFPIMARYFSVEQYGIIDAFTVLSSLFVNLLVFGQDSSVARYFYEYNDNIKKKSIISQSLIVQIVFLVIIVPFLYLFAGGISKFYSNSDTNKFIVEIIILQIPFGLFINFSANILKWTFKRYHFLFLQLGSSILYVFAIIIGIFFFKIGILETFVIFLMSRIIFGIIGLYLISDWLIFKLNYNYISKLFLYGIPFGTICIIDSALPAIDRVFISHFLTEFHLGLYAVAYKLAFLLMLPINAFQTAWGPFYLSLFKEKNNEVTYNSVLLLFTASLCLIGLILILFAKPIIIILAGEKFIASSQIVFPLVLSLIIMSFGWIIGIGIDISMKSYFKLPGYLLRIFFSGLTIILLIKPLGLLGIAIGMLVGQIVYTSTELYFAYRANPLRFKLYDSFSLVLIMSILASSSLVIDSKSYFHQHLINFFLLLTFITIVLYKLRKKIFKIKMERD